MRGSLPPSFAFRGVNKPKQHPSICHSSRQAMQGAHWLLPAPDLPPTPFWLHHIVLTAAAAALLVCVSCAVENGTFRALKWMEGHGLVCARVRVRRARAPRPLPLPPPAPLTAGCPLSCPPSIIERLAPQYPQTETSYQRQVRCPSVTSPPSPSSSTCPHSQQHRLSQPAGSQWVLGSGQLVEN